MDRIRKEAFLATIGALIGLEVASLFLHRLPWARGFTPLNWTAMVRCADIFLFFVLFRIQSIPVSTVGLRNPVKGSIIGLAASLVLGSGFLLVLYSTRLLWGVDLRAFVDPGVRVQEPGPLVVLCLLGPFVEEVFFRGLCYTLIRAQAGVWIAVVLSALAFGTSHFLGAGTFGVVLVPVVGGIVFALLYEFTDSLFAPCVLHGVANFILFSRIL